MKFKKAFSFMVGIVTVFSMSLSSFADDSSAFKNPPSPIPEGPEQYTIINGDNRTVVSNTKVSPYRSIAKLVITYPNKTLYGTGFMIGPRHMATAGHVIDDERYGKATSITAYFGATSKNNYNGVAKASKFWANSNWVNNHNSNYDYGIIEFNSVPSSTGWLGLWAANDTELQNMGTIHVTGYQARVPEEIQQGDQTATWSMLTQAGTLRSFQSTYLDYTIDTLVGQSGAPVYDNDRFAIGINTYGDNTTKEDHVTVGYNSANRITLAAYNFYKPYFG